MRISREDVLRVAELAHLELSAEEIELYRNQLDGILNYIGKLEQLDVTGVEPMVQAFPAAGETEMKTQSEASKGVDSLREDALRACQTANEVLKTAPDAAGPFFRVPKVIER